MQPSPPDFVFALRSPPAIEFALAGNGCSITIGAPQTSIDLALAAFMRGPKGDQGDAGPGAGPVQTLTGIAGATLSGHRCVGMAADGRYTYVDAGTLADGLRFAGVTTGAVDIDAPVTVQTGGPMSEPSWAWTPFAPLYVGATGLLTQIPPARPAAVFSEIVGFARSSTTIFIRPQPPITII